MALSMFLLPPLLSTQSTRTTGTSSIPPCQRNSSYIKTAVLFFLLHIINTAYLTAAVETPITTMSLRKNNMSSSSTPPPPPLKGGSGGSFAFNNKYLWQTNKVILGVNALGLAINLVSNTHYHVDLLGTGAFAIGALLPVFGGNSNSNILTSTATTKSQVAPKFPFRVQASAVAVATWSVKLAGFLFWRVLQSGHDGRLDGVMSTASGATGFWIISALWGIVCALPHTLGTTSPKHPGNPLATRIGLGMFAAGFITETLADYQKYAFKSNHAAQHRGHQFCDAGLWYYSQHPNYFGNILLWTGILVLNAPALIDNSVNVTKSISNNGNNNKTTAVLSNWWKRYRRVALASVGPMFMLALFEAQVRGIILGDALDSKMQKYGYGKDIAFTKYIDNTPKIFPNFFKS